MDSSDWLQGTIHDESGLDSSSPSGGDILTCARPLIERRLRPPHDQAINCPRCESTHTKFCYYNNYSLSQPRYFCKTCRRYWTKGGTLRNIPVGGGCRKNKKVATNNKKSSNDHHHKSVTINNVNPSSSASASVHPADLHLLFPEMHLSHRKNITNFMENPIRAPIDFMESKFEAIVNGSSRNNNNYDFMGGNNNNNNDRDFGIIGGLGVVDHMGHGVGITPNFHGIFSPYGIDGNIGGGFAADSQRIMLPYDHSNEDDIHQQGIDVKLNTKMLSLEWQDQRCSDAGKNHSYGTSYMNNLGSWTGMMN